MALRISVLLPAGIAGFSRSSASFERMKWSMGVRGQIPSPTSGSGGAFKGWKAQNARVAASHLAADATVGVLGATSRSPRWARASPS